MSLVTWQVHPSEILLLRYWCHKINIRWCKKVVNLSIKYIVWFRGLFCAGLMSYQFRDKREWFFFFLYPFSMSIFIYTCLLLYMCVHVQEFCNTPRYVSGPHHNFFQILHPCKYFTILLVNIFSGHNLKIN